jgi:hypothetical protein
LDVMRKTDLVILNKQTIFHISRRAESQPRLPQVSNSLIHFIPDAYAHAIVAMRSSMVPDVYENSQPTSSAEYEGLPNRMQSDFEFTRTGRY